jgi:RNA polymerase sigma-70 factor, ECF subfamily
MRLMRQLCSFAWAWASFLVRGDMPTFTRLPLRDPGDPSGTAAYFILLQWAGDSVVNIRDFRFARYATDGAELHILS